MHSWTARRVQTRSVADKRDRVMAQAHARSVGQSTITTAKVHTSPGSCSCSKLAASFTGHHAQAVCCWLFLGLLHLLLTIICFPTPSAQALSALTFLPDSNAADTHRRNKLTQLEPKLNENLFNFSSSLFQLI